MLVKPWAIVLRQRVSLGFVTAFLLITAAIAFAGYQRLFSSFADYDDEGYVMLSLRQFMAGGALYDEVYSQYGPAYYWLAAWFHQLSDWPVTHDVTRFKTLAVWMGVSLLAAAWLYRVTRSGIFALIGLLFVSLHLERMAMEPGHPQELCILCVAACMFLATFIQGTSKDACVIAGMGLATAICLMTKVNVGLFLFLSISAALLFATQASRWRSRLLVGVLAAMVVLPIVIGRHELWSWHGYRLPVVLTIAVGLTAWVGTRIELNPMLELRHSFCYWSVSACVSAFIALGTVAAGTSWKGLVDGLLLQHMSFVDVHYHDPPIAALGPLAALAAVFLARNASPVTKTLRGCELVGRIARICERHGASRRFLPRKRRSARPVASAKTAQSHYSQPLRVLQVMATVLVLGAAVRHLVESFQPLYHGSQDRGQIGLLVSYFAAYAWIILLPLRDETVKQHASLATTRFARLSLCLIAVLQPLIAYPVPGTQMAIGSVALVVALLTVIHDAIERFRRAGRFEAGASRGLVTVLAGLLLTTVLCRDVYLWSERARLPSLRLAGANRLRLSETTVARERWTVEQLRQRADTFVCLPSGHNSLYLWSGIEPATGFNATVWQDLLTDDHQRQIIVALNKRLRVCVVVEHSESPSLRNNGLLLDFLRQNFEPVATHGTREIWQRRPVALGKDGA